MDRKKPTKYYSSRQEKMIADYLGWSVVSGSGARAFNPGDIRSDSFLGECKTFTEVSDTVYCYHSVWDKICKEAKSVMKLPVLFVDNGSQDKNHTWCVVPKTFVAFVLCSKFIDNSSLIRTSKTRISFSESDMRKAFKEHQKSTGSDVVSIAFKLCGEDVALVSLDTLKLITE